MSKAVKILNDMYPYTLSKFQIICFSMKKSTIHYNYHSFWNSWQKIFFKPLFKYNAAHCSVIFKRYNNFICYFSGGNSRIFISESAYMIKYKHSFRSISIFSVNISIYSGFIDIRNYFLRNI